MVVDMRQEESKPLTDIWDFHPKLSTHQNFFSSYFIHNDPNVKDRVGRYAATGPDGAWDNHPSYKRHHTSQLKTNLARLFMFCSPKANRAATTAAAYKKRRTTDQSNAIPIDAKLLESAPAEVPKVAEIETPIAVEKIESAGTQASKEEAIVETPIVVEKTDEQSSDAAPKIATNDVTPVEEPKVEIIEESQASHVAAPAEEPTAAIAEIPKVVEDGQPQGTEDGEPTDKQAFQEQPSVGTWLVNRVAEPQAVA